MGMGRVKRMKRKMMHGYLPADMEGIDMEQWVGRIKFTR
jgi:hypothetical protein